MIDGSRFRSNKGPLALLRGARALVDASRELASEMSNESESWFRFSLSAAERSVVWAEQRVGALAGRVRLWPSPKRSRERIRLLLRKEAKRAPVVVPPAELDLLMEKMAILIDLVLSGSIGANDVAFESADASSYEHHQSTVTEAP